MPEKKMHDARNRNRNRNENTRHTNSNCRSVKFTDHLYMRGRKKELPPLGIGRTMWPPPTPGQDSPVSKRKSFVSKLDLQAQGRKRLALRHLQAEQQVFDLVRLLLPWTEVGKTTFRVYQISCELRKSKILSISLFFQSEIFWQIKCYIPTKTPKFPHPPFFWAALPSFTLSPFFCQT